MVINLYYSKKTFRILYYYFFLVIDDMNKTEHFDTFWVNVK